MLLPPPSLSLCPQFQFLRRVPVKVEEQKNPKVIQSCKPLANDRDLAETTLMRSRTPEKRPCAVDYVPLIDHEVESMRSERERKISTMIDRCSAEVDYGEWLRHSVVINATMIIHQKQQQQPMKV